MLIKKKSLLTGVTREREISITQEQLNLWDEGTLIQVAMPNITPSDREFIMTGIIDEEWDTLRSEDD